MLLHRLFLFELFCATVFSQALVGGLPPCVVNVQSQLIEQASETAGCSNGDTGCICDFVENSADWTAGLYCLLAACETDPSSPYPIATAGVNYMNSICNAQLTPFAVCPNVIPDITTITTQSTTTATSYITSTAYSPRLTVTSYTATANEITGTQTVTSLATVTAAAAKRSIANHQKRQNSVLTLTVTNGVRTVYNTVTRTSTNDCEVNAVGACYTTIYGTSFNEGQALTTIINTVTLLSSANETPTTLSSDETQLTTLNPSGLGGDNPQAPLEIGLITTPVVLPTTPFKGQPLLTGTCTEALWTAVVLDSGVVMQFPVVGCNDNNPKCCPSLPASLTPRTVCPSPTNAVEVLLPICPNEEVPAALSAHPLTICPSDYTEIGNLCCPYGFSVYDQKIMGQTPCYINTTPLPTPSTLAEFETSLISAIQATASAGSSPTVTVDIVTTQVFALSLPKRTSSTGLSTGAQAGIGVGAGLGGLLLLLSGCWAFLFARRRRRKAQESAPGDGSTTGAGTVGTDPFNEPSSTGQVSPYQPSQSTHSGGLAQPIQYGSQTYYPPPPVPAGAFGRDYLTHYHPTGSPSPPLEMRQSQFEEQRRELGGNLQIQMLQGSNHYPNEMSATPGPRG